MSIFTSSTAATYSTDVYVYVNELRSGLIRSLTHWICKVSYHVPLAHVMALTMTLNWLMWQLTESVEAVRKGPSIQPRECSLIYSVTTLEWRVMNCMFLVVHLGLWKLMQKHSWSPHTTNHKVLCRKGHGQVELCHHIHTPWISWILLTWFWRENTEWLPTGFGKSLCYEALPFVCNWKTGPNWWWKR